MFRLFTCCVLSLAGITIYGMANADDLTPTNAQDSNIESARRHHIARRTAESEEKISECLRSNRLSTAFDTANQAQEFMRRECGPDNWRTILFRQIALDISRAKGMDENHQAIYCGWHRTICDAQKALNGKFDAASIPPSLKDQLSLIDGLMGDQSTSYLTTLLVVATVDGCEQKYDTMKSRFAEAASLAEKMLGRENPLYTRALEGIGIAQLNSGAFDEAEKTLRDNLSIQERMSGKQTPDYVAGQVNLSIVLLKKGNLLEAESLAQQAASTCAQHGNRSSRTYGVCNRQLGEVLLAQKRVVEADACFEKSIAAFEASSPLSEVLVAAYEQRAGVLLTQGRHEDAASLSAKAAAVRRLWKKA